MNLPHDNDEGWDRLKAALKEQDEKEQMIEALGPHVVKAALACGFLLLLTICILLYWILVIQYNLKLPPTW